MWLPIAVFERILRSGLVFSATMFGSYLGVEESEALTGKPIVMGLSIAAGLLGILLGWLVYGRKTMAHASEPDPLAVALGGLFTFLNRKWYIDELYEATVLSTHRNVWCVVSAVRTTVVIDGNFARDCLDHVGISQIFLWGGDEFLHQWRL